MYLYDMPFGVAALGGPALGGPTLGGPEYIHLAMGSARPSAGPVRNNNNNLLC